MIQKSFSSTVFALAILATAPLHATVLLYSSQYNGAVVTYDYTLSPVSAISTSAATFAQTATTNPESMAFDTSANLYVSCYNDNSIKKYSPTGTLVSTITATLDKPDGLVFDTSGNLYVANYGNNTISKFDPSGNGSVFFNTNLAGPVGLAIQGPFLYASNYDNNTISKFNLDGSFVSNFTDGSLSGPAGIAVNSSGELYVANYLGTTVSKFVSDGYSSSISGFSGPYGVAIDANDNLYVANYNAKSISKIDGAVDVPIGVWSTSGFPIGLAFGPAPVPEPSTWVMGLTGIACVGWQGYRRRRAR